MNLKTEQLLKKLHDGYPDTLSGELGWAILRTELMAATLDMMEGETGAVHRPLFHLDDAVKLFPTGWGAASDTEGFAWTWCKTTGRRVDMHVQGAPARALCMCAVMAWSIVRGEHTEPGSVRWDVRAFNAAFSTACRKNDAKAMYVALVPKVGGKEGQFTVLTGGDAQACQLVETYLRRGGMEL